MLTRLRWWWRIRRMSPAERVALDKALSIERIRLNMWAMGYDVCDMTDEEIEQGVMGLSRAMAATGVTAAEASDAIRCIANVKL